MSKLELRQVTRAYGETRVLVDFSLEVAVGGRLVVLGPSGCGKTTLLRLIAGLDLPDAGEVLLDGQLVSRPTWGLPPHLRDLSMVFQSPALWPHMTVAENIHFGLGTLDRASARTRTAEVLAGLELNGLDDRYPHQLSGGEARRVALARALAPRRSLLLLDEPLTHLNPDLKVRVLDVLQEHLAQHQPTLIYVTHDAEEAQAIVSSSQPSGVVVMPGREAA